MKKAYLGCIKQLRKLRKSLLLNNDIKRGKLYFEWLDTKTQKIEKEQKQNYIYENIVKYTLSNYKIDKYIYERLNKNIKTIVDNK